MQTFIVDINKTDIALYQNQLPQFHFWIGADQVFVDVGDDDVDLFHKKIHAPVTPASFYDLTKGKLNQPNIVTKTFEVEFLPNSKLDEQTVSEQCDFVRSRLPGCYVWTGRSNHLFITIIDADKHVLDALANCIKEFCPLLYVRIVETTFHDDYEYLEIQCKDLVWEAKTRLIEDVFQTPDKDGYEPADMPLYQALTLPDDEWNTLSVLRNLGYWSGAQDEFWEFNKKPEDYLGQ